jgi:NAD-dependent SIR2 family protein deacetylase
MIVPGVEFVICNACEEMLKTHLVFYEDDLFIWVPRQKGVA